jgi:conjugative relaxase-like TrwC/TraI family protein
MEGERGEPMPFWHGQAAALFGLSGVAEKEHVERVCAGFDPHEPTRKLVRNAGKETRNPGHDLTFSAPKSVSCAWSIADPELRRAIEEAHRAAVKAALSFLEEKCGFARIGTDGQERTRVPLLFALFDHGTSRADDQQVHTHALLINATRHHDGRTTAIDPTEFYHWKMAGGSVYRLVLGHKMLNLGFHLKERRIGSSIGWELACIPEAWMEANSKRRAEIEEVLAIRKGSLDAADSRYAELVCQETKRKKDLEKPRAELFAKWEKEALEHGMTPEFLRSQLEHGPKFTELRPEVMEQRKADIWKAATNALAQQFSHWNEADLTKTLTEQATAKLRLRDVRELIAEKMRTRELIPLGEVQTERPNHERNQYAEKWQARFTTPEVLAEERAMLRAIRRIVKEERPGCSREAVEEAIRKATPELDQEQAQAVRHLLSGPGIRIMSGVSGSGKTMTMAAVVEAMRLEGRERELIGCSIGGKAATKLEAETGIESGTFASLLWQLDNSRLSLKNRTVVIDESGMVPTRELGRLIPYLEKEKTSRLILLGDVQQLTPIAAGQPMRLLSELLGEKRLTIVRRQEQRWHREAVSAFERGDVAEAMKAFIENKCFHMPKRHEEAKAQIIEQWKKDGGIEHPEDVWLLTSTNATVTELNRRCQAARIEARVVSADKKIFANGVFLHEGDRMMFLKKSKELDVDNGDAATVLHVDPERQRLTAKLQRDGREIAVNFQRYSGKNLALSYCGTNHKLQGQTEPIVHFLMDSPGMLERSAVYVATSRSQRSTHIFCDQETVGPEVSDLVRTVQKERHYQKTMAAQVVLERQRRERQQERTRGPSLDLSL